jgi:hypothetical protein
VIFCVQSTIDCAHALTQRATQKRVVACSSHAVWNRDNVQKRPWFAPFEAFSGAGYIAPSRRKIHTRTIVYPPRESRCFESWSAPVIERGLAMRVRGATVIVSRHGLRGDSARRFNRLIFRMTPCRRLGIGAVADP